MISYKQLNSSNKILIGELPTKADLAIVSIDEDGNAGRLNLFVLKEYGYSIKDIPKKEQLGYGFSYLSSNNRKSILFVVTISGKDDSKNNLKQNLFKALINSKDRLENKVVWLPLMGTGDGGLSFKESLFITVDTINLFLENNPTEIVFSISLPNNDEGKEFLEIIREEQEEYLEDYLKISSAVKKENIQYWLLKLNPDSFDFDNFEEGEEIWFGTLNTKFHKRPEYDLFFKIKKGDKVIGYGTGKYQAIIWILEIVDEAKNHDAFGESIKLEILEIKNPPISFNSFSNYLSDSTKSEITENSPKRLFSIDAKTFRQLSKSSTNIGEKKYSYNFPRIPLTDNEKKYLEIIYKNFLAAKEIDTPLSLQEVWNDFPPEFDAYKINHLLVSGGRDITLWGIWHIHPESDIFEKVDKVINEIKNILSKGDLQQAIISKQIQFILPYSDLELFQLFKLISQFGNLSNGTGRDKSLNSSLNINSTIIYEQYRRYSGLQSFMNDFLSKNGVDFNAFGFNINLDEPKIDSAISYSKTQILRKHSKDFVPVMGVKDLANDLAEIINALPEEKGQMIGIFGKWGRGKSFLMEELWKVLDKGFYIRVDYHAWKYQQTPASWAYLYEILAKKYVNKPELEFTFKCLWKLVCYYRRVIWLNIKRKGVSPIFKFLFAIIPTIATWIISYKKLGLGYTLVTGSVTSLGFMAFLKKLSKDNSTKAVDLIKKFTAMHSFKEKMGIQADIQDELIKLLKVWMPENGEKKQKVLLVVEDIDRCTEERIIQNIDALRVMLDDEEISKRLIIITAIDERILKNAIETKYNSLFANNEKYSNIENNDENSIYDKSLKNELISEYLDKLFISAIKLGGLNNIQRQEFLDELIKDHSGKQIDKELKNEIENQAEVEKENREKSSLANYGSSFDIAIRNGDFVIKDGDISLEDTNGNLVSSLDLEINTQNKWEKLNPIEVTFLGDIIKDWSEATPRRISIFYFRYLLCKNLLISKYALTKEPNGWQETQGIKALMILLLEHSNKYNPDEILEEKNRIVKLPDSNEFITLESIANFSINRKDYLYLLEIFELVIAY